MAVTRLFKCQSLKVGFLIAVCVYLFLTFIDLILYNKPTRDPNHLVLNRKMDLNHLYAITPKGKVSKIAHQDLEKIFLHNDTKYSNLNWNFKGHSNFKQWGDKLEELRKPPFPVVAVDAFETEQSLSALKPELPPRNVTLEDLPFMRDGHYRPSKCPKTVTSLTRYSRWFRDRFQSNVKIFLEKADILSYRNYYRLLHYRLPFGFNNANKTKLRAITKHSLFNDNPLTTSKNRNKCTTCAVIGCGGILNGSKAGPEIDNHDFVFRLNHAKSSGDFGDDVGHKTSFYTFFPESMHIPEVEDKDATYFFSMFKTYDMDYVINILNDKNPPTYRSRGRRYRLRKPDIDPQKLKIIHPDFFRYVFTKYLDGKSERPTTGAIVVFLALHLCDEVTIYGFGYDSRFTLHYYDKEFMTHTDRSTALHDVDNERELWLKLHDEGIIRLFKRDL
ncbi:CMP-N-acetylneuraminate-beta-galactosamide-alpha-2,3-sialyltransferase 1-like [Asterias rubens]|uniref:CMP-N-acetylneuraminate-beta-galactosamide- alpha-2,3-sialyltransferase 1-like n=1 Tax=Asterias rubens TaxID=7604 RepID=UPI0014559670|nr:CMP-N-acetylneuraminate-beta-galactosamide-alpha-2,3-sialyltransferase 1-like [Asterias rubens]XP_033639209.1 CMP-N-acetylneuraminate-beta-galactosamide-alpha-2,3-sialyltransferase 1-like [Asterias rubens]